MRVTISSDRHTFPNLTLRCQTDTVDGVDHKGFSDFARFNDEVARLRGRLRELFEPSQTGTGLNEMEITVLTAVVNASRPPTVAQIGRSLGHPRQVVQRASNRLADLALITTEPNPEHRRASLLVPTPRGAAIKASNDTRAQRIAADLLSRMDAGLIATTADHLSAIRLTIETYLKDEPCDDPC